MLDGLIPDNSVVIWCQEKKYFFSLSSSYLMASDTTFYNKTA